MTFPTRTVAMLPPGSAFSRWIICLAKSEGDPMAAAEMAATHYRDSPTVQATCQAFYTKAAMAPGTTTDADWAMPLAQYGIGAEALVLLQSNSIFGRLQASLRRVPFRTKVAREIGSGAGAAWHGEGVAKPVTSTAFDLLQQDRHEVTTILLVSRELLQFSSVAEATLRGVVAAALAKFVDQQLLDPTVTATATHPASLTANATEVTQSGTTAANVITDLEALMAAIESPGDTLRWVMRPTTYFRIVAKLAGVGYPTAPGLLLNIPVILGSTSPQQVTLIDGSSVVYSSDDIVVLDVATQGTLQADDAPVDDASAVLVSLYQSNVFAIRARVVATWQPAFFSTGSPAMNAGVSFMTVSY